MNVQQQTKKQVEYYTSYIALLQREVCALELRIGKLRSQLPTPELDLIDYEKRLLNVQAEIEAKTTWLTHYQNRMFN